LAPELELSLDLPMDADALPTDVDDALDAEAVLSAVAVEALRHNARAATRGRVAFRMFCMGAWQMNG
jgi:hypothetical protein